MITKNIANMSTAGTTIVRTGSTFWAALIVECRRRRSMPSRSTSPRLSTDNGLVNAVGDRLVDPRRSEPPRSDLAVDHSREPVARKTSSLGLSE